MKTIALAAAALLASASVFAAAPASATLVVNASTIGKRVIVQNTGTVTATFERADADLASSLYLVGRDGAIFQNKVSTVGSTVNLGSFAAGTELVFRLDVPGTSYFGPAASYFTGAGSRNPDGVAHAAVSMANGRTYVGFEDLNAWISDCDYNDLVFSFTNTATAAVPEPATWAAMLLGFGMVGAGMRTRRRSTKVTYA
jgi:hypothetical protein